MYRTIQNCRSCGSDRLAPILNLGNLYISDFVDGMEARRGRAPLELVLCEECSLLQLKYTVNPELLYREYLYKSSVNPIMVKALKDIVSKAEKLVDLKAGDMVIDIGCNDGTLLRAYETWGLKLVGFEPASNLVEEARKGTTLIINDFFTINPPYFPQKAKVITAIAMFYDLQEPNRFVSDVARCLDKDGVFIIEQRYLPSMLEQADVGNVVHEHLEYYSLLSLKPLLERHGLEVFDVELNDVNGGSFRTYIKRRDGNVTPFEGARARLRNLVVYEKRLRLNSKKPYEDFAERVRAIREEVRGFILDRWEHGEHIYVYGASTKGNTVLQYFDLRYPVIAGAAERDPRKFGKKTVGTWIPIVSEEVAREKADYFLVLIWFYKGAILEREREFRKKGGRLLFPFAEFEVVGL